MVEQTLEQLYENLEKLGKTANKMETFMAMHENDKDKDAATKKADDEKKEEELKEAKKAKTAKYISAINKAMEEPTDEKKEAAVRKAMSDHGMNDEKKGMDMNHDKKDAMTDEEKDKEAAIASIIGEKRGILVNKILTANRIINPTKLVEIEARLKTASIIDLTKEANMAEQYVGNVIPDMNIPNTQVTPAFMAGFVTPESIDTAQLNASSPDSAFAKFSTKELLEMGAQ